MACPPTFSRALAPDTACNPSARSSVIIFRRSQKTAIPLNTEGASVKIRSAKIARFYRRKFAHCRLRTGAVLGEKFVTGGAKGWLDFGNFPEIHSLEAEEKRNRLSRISGPQKPKSV
jgi:hypothetical protein